MVEQTLKHVDVTVCLLLIGPRVAEQVTLRKANDWNLQKGETRFNSLKINSIVRQINVCNWGLILNEL